MRGVFSFGLVKIHPGLASFPGLPWLRGMHTASDQKPEPGKAWERGYPGPHSCNILPYCMETSVIRYIRRSVSSQLSLGRVFQRCMQRLCQLLTWISDGDEFCKPRTGIKAQGSGSGSGKESWQAIHPAEESRFCRSEIIFACTLIVRDIRC